MFETFLSILALLSGNFSSHPLDGPIPPPVVPPPPPPPPVH
jgi:hypothetical protein